MTTLLNGTRPVNFVVRATVLVSAADHRQRSDSIRREIEVESARLANGGREEFGLIARPRHGNTRSRIGMHAILAMAGPGEEIIIRYKVASLAPALQHFSSNTAV